MDINQDIYEDQEGGLKKLENFSRGNKKIYEYDGMAYFIEEGGNVWALGENYNGKLGIGVENDSVDVLTQVKGITTEIEKIYMTHANTYVIGKDGSLWSWGDNSYGQLGIGSTQAKSTIPVKVETITGKVIKFYTDDEVCYAIDENGNLWSWGYNGYGQVGIDSYESVIYQPTKITAITDKVKEVSLNRDNVTYIISEDGTLWGVGANGNGQLGVDSDESTILIPTKISTIGKVKEMHIMRNNERYAISEDGSLWVWGNNYQGQLGIGMAENTIEKPVKATKITSKIRTVHKNGDYAFAEGEDNSVWLLYEGETTQFVGMKRVFKYDNMINQKDQIFVVDAYSKQLVNIGKTYQRTIQAGDRELIVCDDNSILFGEYYPQ